MSRAKPFVCIKSCGNSIQSGYDHQTIIGLETGETSTVHREDAASYDFLNTWGATNPPGPMTMIFLWLLEMIQLIFAWVFESRIPLVIRRAFKQMILPNPTHCSSQQCIISDMARATILRTVKDTALGIRMHHTQQNAHGSILRWPETASHPF